MEQNQVGNRSHAQNQNDDDDDESEKIIALPLQHHPGEHNEHDEGDDDQPLAGLHHDSSESGDSSSRNRSRSSSVAAGDAAGGHHQQQTSTQSAGALPPVEFLIVPEGMDGDSNDSGDSNHQPGRHRGQLPDSVSPSGSGSRGGLLGHRVYGADTAAAQSDAAATGRGGAAGGGGAVPTVGAGHTTVLGHSEDDDEDEPHDDDSDAEAEDPGSRPAAPEGADTIAAAITGDTTHEVDLSAPIAPSSPTKRQQQERFGVPQHSPKKHGGATTTTTTSSGVGGSGGLVADSTSAPSSVTAPRAEALLTTGNDPTAGTGGSHPPIPPSPTSKQSKLPPHPPSSQQQQQQQQSSPTREPLMTSTSRPGHEVMHDPTQPFQIGNNRRKQRGSPGFNSASPTSGESSGKEHHHHHHHHGHHHNHENQAGAMDDGKQQHDGGGSGAATGALPRTKRRLFELRKIVVISSFITVLLVAIGLLIGIAAWLTSVSSTQHAELHATIVEYLKNHRSHIADYDPFLLKVGIHSLSAYPRVDYHLFNYHSDTYAKYNATAKPALIPIMQAAAAINGRPPPTPPEVLEQFEAFSPGKSLTQRSYLSQLMSTYEQKELTMMEFYMKKAASHALRCTVGENCYKTIVVFPFDGEGMVFEKVALMGVNGKGDSIYHREHGTDGDASVPAVVIGRTAHFQYVHKIPYEETKLMCKQPMTLTDPATNDVFRVLADVFVFNVTTHTMEPLIVVREHYIKDSLPLEIVYEVKLSGTTTFNVTNLCNSTASSLAMIEMVEESVGFAQAGKRVSLNSSDFFVSPHEHEEGANNAEGDEHVDEPETFFVNEDQKHVKHICHDIEYHMMATKYLHGTVYTSPDSVYLQCHIFAQPIVSNDGEYVGHLGIRAGSEPEVLDMFKAVKDIAGDLGEMYVLFSDVPLTFADANANATAVNNLDLFDIGDSWGVGYGEVKVFMASEFEAYGKYCRVSPESPSATESPGENVLEWQKTNCFASANHSGVLGPLVTEYGNGFNVINRSLDVTYCDRHHDKAPYCTTALSLGNLGPRWCFFIVTFRESIFAKRALSLFLVPLPFLVIAVLATYAGTSYFDRNFASIRRKMELGTNIRKLQTDPEAVNELHDLLGVKRSDRHGTTSSSAGTGSNIDTAENSITSPTSSHLSNSQFGSATAGMRSPTSRDRREEHSSSDSERHTSKVAENLGAKLQQQSYLKEFHQLNQAVDVLLLQLLEVLPFLPKPVSEQDSDSVSSFSTDDEDEEEEEEEEYEDSASRGASDEQTSGNVAGLFALQQREEAVNSNSDNPLTTEDLAAAARTVESVRRQRELLEQATADDDMVSPSNPLALPRRMDTRTSQPSSAHTSTATTTTTASSNNTNNSNASANKQQQQGGPVIGLNEPEGEAGSGSFVSPGVGDGALIPSVRKEKKQQSPPQDEQQKALQTSNTRSPSSAKSVASPNSTSTDESGMLKALVSVEKISPRLPPEQKPYETSDVSGDKRGKLPHYHHHARGAHQQLSDSASVGGSGGGRQGVAGSTGFYQSTSSRVGGHMRSAGRSMGVFVVVDFGPGCSDDDDEPIRFAAFSSVLAVLSSPQFSGQAIIETVEATSVFFTLNCRSRVRQAQEKAAAIAFAIEAAIFNPPPSKDGNNSESQSTSTVPNTAESSRRTSVVGGAAASIASQVPHLSICIHTGVFSIQTVKSRELKSKVLVSECIDMLKQMPAIARQLRTRILTTETVAVMTPYLAAWVDIVQLPFDINVHREKMLQHKILEALSQQQQQQQQLITFGMSHAASSAGSTGDVVALAARELQQQQQQQQPQQPLPPSYSRQSVDVNTSTALSASGSPTGATLHSAADRVSLGSAGSTSAEGVPQLPHSILRHQHHTATAQGQQTDAEQRHAHVQLHRLSTATTAVTTSSSTTDKGGDKAGTSATGSFGSAAGGSSAASSVPLGSPHSPPTQQHQQQGGAATSATDVQQQQQLLQLHLSQSLRQLSTTQGSITNVQLASASTFTPCVRLYELRRAQLPHSTEQEEVLQSVLSSMSHGQHVAAVQCVVDYFQVRQRRAQKMGASASASFTLLPPISYGGGEQQQQQQKEQEQKSTQPHHIASTPLGASDDSDFGKHNNKTGNETAPPSQQQTSSSSTAPTTSVPRRLSTNAPSAALHGPQSTAIIPTVQKENAEATATTTTTTQQQPATGTQFGGGAGTIVPFAVPFALGASGSAASGSGAGSGVGNNSSYSQDHSKSQSFHHHPSSENITTSALPQPQVTQPATSPASTAEPQSSKGGQNASMSSNTSSLVVLGDPMRWADEHILRVGKLAACLVEGQPYRRRFTGLWQDVEYDESCFRPAPVYTTPTARGSGAGFLEDGSPIVRHEQQQQQQAGGTAIPRSVRE